MTGPPPKDPSVRRRRNATPGFRQLPAEGRSGPAPDFPLSAPTQAELEMWSRLWALPQATEWERIQCEDMVALYVRTFSMATSAGVEGAQLQKLLAEVRQLDSKIGISPSAMQALRWERADPPQAEEKANGTAEAVPEEEAPFVPRD